MDAAEARASQLRWHWDHRCGSDTLIAVFNSCAHRDPGAHGASPHLELSARLAPYGCSTLWFVESGEPLWYLEFDRLIQHTLHHAASAPGIRRLLLLGASAGGYAAIRHAALWCASGATALPIRVAAVNPQTGFEPTLLQGLRDGLAAAGRDPSALGRNPVLPQPASLAAAAPRMLAGTELAALLAAPGLQRGVARIDVHHDAANPIDRGFAGALLAARAPCVHLRPQSLDLEHDHGCGVLMQSTAFVADVESALGLAPRAPRKPFLAVLRSTDAVAALAGPRSFDVAFSLDAHAEGATPEACAPASPVFVHRQAGPRWPALAAALQAHWNAVRLYRHVWLPAAGVVVDVAAVDTLFDACDALQLDLAQPALRRDSPDGDPASRPHAAFQLRFTNHVGPVAPLLSKALLKRVLALMSAPVPPADLVKAWALCLPPGRTAIVDVAALHCRTAAAPATDTPLALAGLLRNGDTVFLDAGGGDAATVRAALNDALGHAGLHFAAPRTAPERRAA